MVHAPGTQIDYFREVRKQDKRTMRARKTRVFWIGVVVAVALLLSLALLGVHAEELRGAANAADGRRLGANTLPDWLQVILQRVATLLGAVPIPELRSESDEGDSASDFYDEGGTDALSDAVDAFGRSGHYSQSGTNSLKGSKGSKSSKGKGKGKGSSKKSSKSSKSSSKKKGKSKSSSSGNYYKLTTPPDQPKNLEIPTATPIESETGAPISGPTLTFAPFSTLAPVPAPSVAPSTDVPLTPTAVPIDSSPNVTASPTNAVPLTTAPVASSPPTVAPTSAAPAPLFQSVIIPTYYIAYAATTADREPTEDEYLVIYNLTTLYFEEILGNLYNNAEPAFGEISSTVFESVESVIDITQYNAGIPEEKYNIYISFETEIIFSTESTVIPSSDEVFDIMLDAITPTYIVNYVWQAPETPFISTQEVLMRPIEVLGIKDQDDEFGVGYISTTGKKQVTPLDEALDADIEVEAISETSDAESSQHDINSFGQGEATDRDFFSPIRERFVLPDSIIKDTIFRNDDNGTREKPGFPKEDKGTR